MRQFYYTYRKYESKQNQIQREVFMSSLKRVLGLTTLSFYGVGMILGAGIYSLIGKAAGGAGESVWISLIIAAFVALLAGLSYAELAALDSRVGGEYIYLRKAFPNSKWIAQTIGLMMVFAGLTTCSAVALSFAGYFQQFIILPHIVIAFGLIFIFSVINFIGISTASWVNILFTLIEISGLLIFIWFGQQSPNFYNSLSPTISSATFSTSALIIFAYFGFENIVNFSEETIDPSKNIPNAILVSIFVSTVLYVLVALSALALLPLEKLIISEAPLSDALTTISPRMAGMLGAIALFATANTVLISLVTCSRILLGMSRDSSLHVSFSQLSSKRKTPWFAILICLIAATFLLPLGEVDTLANISSFSTMAAFLSVHIALIRLRFIEPNIPRPFRIPLNFYSLPLIPTIGFILTAILLLQFEKTVYLIGGSYLAFLLVVIFVVEKFQSSKS